MKIRIKGNSLRYRLTKTDVAAFAANGCIEESIDFGSQALTYALQKTGFNNLSVIFENNKITLFMPEAMINEWVLTQKVGFEYRDAELFLLVEKDFKCLDDVAEDQSDHYPNPLMKV
jgi:hypothetical protein